MRKLWKKVSACLLAGIMATAMCVPAFATSTSTGGSSLVPVTAGATADIVVGVSSPDGAAANGGDTLEAYKVVDITYAQASNNLVYGFTDLFETFLASTSGDEFATLTPASYGELEADDLKPLLGSFAAYVKGLAVEPTPAYTAVADEAGIANFTEVAMGQYIIIGAGTSNGAKIYQTVTAEVEPEIVDGIYNLYTSYTVAMKTSTPSINY